MSDYKPLSDDQLRQLRLYVRYEMPAGYQEVVMTLAVLEMGRRANALADAVRVMMDTNRGSVSAESDMREVLAALKSYEGADS